MTESSIRRKILDNKVKEEAERLHSIGLNNSDIQRMMEVYIDAYVEGWNESVKTIGVAIREIF